MGAQWGQERLSEEVTLKEISRGWVGVGTSCGGNGICEGSASGKSLGWLETERRAPGLECHRGWGARCPWRLEASMPAFCV